MVDGKVEKSCFFNLLENHLILQNEKGTTEAK